MKLEYVVLCSNVSELVYISSTVALRGSKMVGFFRHDKKKFEFLHIFQLIAYRC